MKIAFLSYEFTPIIHSGLGMYVSEMAVKLKNLGHDVTVFTTNTTENYFLDREIWRGVQVFRPPILDTSIVFPPFVVTDLRKWGTKIGFFSEVFGRNYAWTTKIIHELAEDYEFDAIVINDWSSAMCGLMLKKHLNIPTVFYLRSTEELRVGGGIDSGLYTSGSQMIKYLERMATRESDLVITPSASMKEHIINVGFEPKRIEVCHEGCDPYKYSLDNVSERQIKDIKARYGASSEKVILFVGRSTWIKGIYHLIQSIPTVLKEFPKVNLIVLGYGTQRDDLCSIVLRMKAQDSVKFRFEWVPEEEKVVHYAMADVCVFPSISEPSGLVALEAMSMQKPVVVGAHGVSGMKEHVVSSGSEQCGLHIYNPRDPTDIASNIVEALDNQKSTQWGANGRHRILTYFNWDNTAKRFLELIGSLQRS